MNVPEIIAFLKDLRVVPRLAGTEVILMGETHRIPAGFIDQIRLQKEELAFYLKYSLDEVGYLPISFAPEQESYGVSPGQKRIWTLCQRKGGSRAYTVLSGFYLDGVIIKKNLENAFYAVIRRHESLRTVFKVIQGEVRQVILKEHDFVLEERFFDGLSGTKDRLIEEMNSWSCLEFDLEKGPLIKAGLFRWLPNEHVLVIALHHIICDGWSIKVLIRELMGFYDGKVQSMEPCRIQYKDYVHWLEMRVSGEKDRLADDFWRARFAKPIEAAELPTTVPRPAVSSFEGSLTKFYLPEDVYPRVTAFCRQNKYTLFNFLRATLTILLGRIGGRSHVVIGTPISGRGHHDLGDQIGLYVNTIPLTAEINGESSFLNFVKYISADSFRTFEFGDYPFDRIVEKAPGSGNAGRNPFFDVMLVVQDMVWGEENPDLFPAGNVKIKSADYFLYGSSHIHRTRISAKLDMTLTFGLEPVHKFYMEIEYAADLFNEEWIARFYESYLYVIRQAIDCPEALLKDIGTVPPAERQRILEQSNNARTDYPENQTVVTMFSEQVLRTPLHIAIAAGNWELSYRELGERSLQLAGYLRERHTVKPNDLIGIKLKRDEWMIIAILGVLRSGGAYVPIDPEYPADRIDFIISDSRCKLVLDEAELEEFRRLPNCYEAGEHTDACKPADLAYVIYTSGSTGRPKGTLIEHGNAASFIHWCRDEFAGSDVDTVLGVTSICFDLSVFEIFYTLTSGKKLTLLPGALSIPQYLHTREKVLLNTVPSVLGALRSQNADLGSVSVLNLAGEPIPPAYLEGLDPEKVEIRNLYGPSESTTYSTVFRIRDTSAICIGRPITNTRLFIMDEYLHVQPVGVPGEICLCGPGVARGYLNRAELTAEKFVGNPAFPGERMYRTGDLGKWLDDGNVEFLGRMDAQVKIRGFRIEPGEIENALLRYPDIGSCVVVAWSLTPLTEKELVAYIAGAGKVDITGVRSFLSQVLPVYMVPGHFVQMSALPLTPNGKIDKSRLPDPPVRRSGKSDHAEPRSLPEQKLQAIWEELLNKSDVGMQENFFELGGNSLKALRLANRIHEEFEVRPSIEDLLTVTTVEDQVRWIQNTDRTPFMPIVPAKQQPSYPLSSAQQRLWVVSQFEESNRAYIMPGAFKLEGNLDADALDRCFNHLIERHEILRTVFRQDERGEVRQFIQSPETSRFNISRQDLRELEKWKAVVDNSIQEKCSEPIDIGKFPLLYITLFRVEDRKWILCCVMHHIISDGWSMNLIMQELISLYNYAVREECLPPNSPKIQYRDYVNWEQTRLAEDLMMKHRNYWLRQMEGELPILELAGERSRPAVKTYNGRTTTRRIDPDLRNRIRIVSRKRNGTLFIGLLTALIALLHRYTGQKDIIVGTPGANREHIDLKDQIGLFANTLALRIVFSGTDNFFSLFDKVRVVMFEAQTHQSFPFDKLVDVLSLQKDPGRNPLFDVMVTLQDKETAIGGYLRGMSGMTLSEYTGWSNYTSKFDLTVDLDDRDDALFLNTTYNNDIYSQQQIGKLTAHFELLLKALVNSPLTPIDSLHYLTPTERHQLLVDFNNTSRIYPANLTIIELFEQQAENTPESVALEYTDTVLSYRELNERANRLGGYLKENYHISENDLVGVKLDRSEWLVISILAVLKTGAAYIPIDMEYPAERIEYMIEDSRCKLIIDGLQLEKFRKDERDYPAWNTSRKIGPDDLLYVIYTSGSSGKPKGAKIRQHSFVNLVCWYRRFLELSARDCVILAAPVSFDLAQKNIFAPLLSGAKLCLPPGRSGDYLALADTIFRKRVSVINVAPSAFYPLLNTFVNASFNKLLTLRKVILGGEPILPGEFRRWIDSGTFKTKVINSYGPTECTDVVSAYQIKDDEWDTLKQVPIGAPVDNCSLYILDENRQLVPVGVIGDIFIAGHCVGNGYLNQPALTAERFISDPFQGNGKMYKTGDLGRWLPDGNIEFAGRKDEQVKIRGYRLEPGEIESTLKTYPAIDAAVVLAQSDPAGEKELVAYLTVKQRVNIHEIRAYLRGRLADYMIPAHFVIMERIPLTPSGKVDRRALSAIKPDDREAAGDYIGPGTETERELVSIWQDLLGRKQVGIKDNFFSLGGHSLKLIRLGIEIGQRFEVNLSFKDLFEHQVLEDQARIISTAPKVAAPVLPVAAVQPHYPLTPSQRRIWVLSQYEAANVAYNITGAYTFTGIIDVPALEKAFRTLIRRHESLRTVFKEDDHGNIRQFILLPEQQEFRIVHKDLRGDPVPEDLWQGTIQRESSLPFDLTQGPLLRACLCRLTERTSRFVYTMHHIISDGWSMKILIGEFARLYNSYVAGGDAFLQPSSIQYKDYAVWQEDRVRNGNLERQKLWWMEQFADALPVLDIPADRVRPAVKSYRGGVVRRYVPAFLLDGLKRLSHRQNGTLFMGLLGVLDILLYKYTNQDDIILGSPVAGREHPELSGQIGAYIDILALRIKFNAEDTYEELFANVRRQVLAAFEHQSYPFDELLNELDLKRDFSRNALFDVMMLLENDDQGANTKIELDNLTVEIYEEVTSTTSKLDLIFTFRESDADFQLLIEYNSDIYDGATIERMARHFEQLLASILERPTDPICKLDISSDIEKQQLLLDFNHTDSLYPDRSVVDMIKEQVEKTPDAIAVVYENRTLTYKELDESSGKFAHFLKAEHGVAASDLVGVCLSRDEGIIIALLGVWKAGAAYVPLDPEYPEQRIAHILLDSGCKILINEAEFEKFLNNGRAGSILTRNSGADCAYVMYTSGSTGAPKGVVIEHRNVSSFLHWCKLEFSSSRFEIVFAATSISFDLSIFELFFPLSIGKRIRLLPNALAIPRYLDKEELILLNTVPSVIGALLNEEVSLHNVSVLNLAGEPIPPKYIGPLVQTHMVVRNLYGPTESTTYSTVFRIVDDRKVMIGRPIANTRAYILGEDLRLQPVGIPGEICLSGAGLARGYLNKPEITEKKFIAHPFRKGERLYRTGDIGRWTADGNIEILGRIDHQVKIRGHRIEPVEIELALQTLGGIEAAIVVAGKNPDGDQQLVAYIRCEAVPDLAAIRRSLRDRLPDYMIPSQFVQLEHFPTTPNGKVDRSKLPDVPSVPDSSRPEYIPPRNALEERMAVIWMGLLGKDKIGMRDNFFESGGHSLKAAQLVSRINREFSVRLSIQELFYEPTLENICERLEFLLYQQENRNKKSTFLTIDI
jgi:amino acid adenylation domain-containing protein